MKHRIIIEVEHDHRIQNRALVGWTDAPTAKDYVEHFMGAMAAAGFHPESVIEAMEAACEARGL